MMEPPWWPLTRCCRLPGAVPGTEGDRRPRDPQLMAMTWRGRGLSGPTFKQHFGIISITLYLSEGTYI